MEIGKNLYIYKYNLSDAKSKENVAFTSAADKLVNEISQETLKNVSEAITSVSKAGINITQKKDISKEKLEELIKSGKETKEICTELGISTTTYGRLLKKYEIVTDYQASVNKVASITKEQFENMVNLGKTRLEICEELGISPGTYAKLKNKFGLKSERKEAESRIASITKEQIEELTASGKSVPEICQELGISQGAYNRLRIKLGMISPLMEMKRKAAAVTKEQIEEQIKLTGGLPKQICSNLGITESIYYRLLGKFGIKTELQQTANHLTSITKEQIVDLINQGKTNEEIYEILGLNESSYLRLLKKFQIKTKSLENHERMNSITKEQIENLKSLGLSPKEVADQLGISVSSYDRLLIKFGLKNVKFKKNISKEQLLELINQDKTVSEICKELGISSGVYSKLLLFHGIQTKYQKAVEQGESVTKEQIENLLAQNKTRQEIYTELGITDGVYDMLLKKFGIKTDYTIAKELNSSITKEQITSLIDEGKSNDEICQLLGISKKTLGGLFNKHGITTKAIANCDNVASIKKEQIINLIAQGKTLNQIADELSISQVTVSNLIIRFGIKTERMQTNERIAAITKKQLQTMLNANKTTAQICEELDIAETTLTGLLRKFNLKTSRFENIDRINSITKEQMQAVLYSGKPLLQMVKDLDVSPSTFTKLLDKYLLSIHKPDAGTMREGLYQFQKYETYTDMQLKERLIEVFVNNKSIAKNENINDLTEFIFERQIPDRENLIKTLRMLDSVESKNITTKEIISKEPVQNLLKWRNDILTQEIARNEAFIRLQKSFTKAANKLYEYNMADLAHAVTMHCPKSVDNLEEGQKWFKIISKYLVKENVTKMDLSNLDSEITYTQLLKSLPNDKLLKEAQEFSKTKYGEILPEKAGQYIRTATNYDLKSFDNYPKEYLDIIKAQDRESSIKFLIKTEDWMNFDGKEKNYINDYLKIFNPEEKLDSEIIKYFIEKIYTQTDTHLILKGDNGNNIYPVILAKPKSDVYNKYKYPDCIEILKEFETCAQRYAPPKGEGGIKIETTGLKRMKIKIMGYKDRIYSTKKDYIFDKWDDKHRNKGNK